MTVRIRPMACGACGNIGVGKPILEYDLSLRRQSFRCTVKRRRIEGVETSGKSRLHRRAEDVRDIEHDVVGTLVLDKSLQLVFDIQRLLSCEARYRIIAIEPLPGWPVT